MTTTIKNFTVLMLGILMVPFFVHADTSTAQLCTALRTLVGSFSSPSAALVSSVESMCPVAPSQGLSQQLDIACPNARALTVGLHETMTHPQVRNLQIFLNNSGSPVAQSGDGSYGNETTYFGTKTEIAVQNWQARNGVVTGGSPETTGYGSVGVQTRAKMVEVACGDDEPSEETNICIPPLYMGPNGTCVRNPGFECPAGQVVNATVTGCVPLSKPSITTTSLPRGVLGSVYSANIVSVGGTGIRNWEVTEGALPPGVYLNKLAFVQGGPTAPVNQGQSATIGVYGTPTAAGTYTFTATVNTGALEASKQFTIVIGSSATANSSDTRACTEEQEGSYGKGCRICVATGELASTVEDQECTAPVLTLQYYPSTNALYWGVVRPQTGGICSASGAWTGVKPNSGEYLRPTSYSGTYSLTCTGAGPAKRVVITANNGTEIITGTTGVTGETMCTTDARMCSDGSYVSRTGPSCSFAACPSGTSISGIVPVGDDVIEINPTNVLQPATKRSADVVVTLKANNSTGPLTVGRGDSLNFTWSSNAPVTNCKRGTNFKNSSAFTQNFGTSGTIPAELARYTYTTSSTQGFDYSISCSYRKDGQNYDTEKGDDVRVNVTPVSTMPASIEPITY